MKARNLVFVGALALALPSTGCMQFDENLLGELTLTTHVTDWREEVIYQVMIDRFADGDAGNNYHVDFTSPAKWHGGDWKGLEDNLPYLEDLGVTALWISPVVKNVDTDSNFDGYHGYWTQDFTQVNPHFGDLFALRRMVRAAHDRNMKVILDIVTNHVGQVFYYDINKNGNPDNEVFGGGNPNQSPVEHVSEFDPEFNSQGIQAESSLGLSGPAPVVFRYEPETNHLPPVPIVFQYPEVYNKKGRTFNFDDLDQLIHGDFPGGLKDLDTKRCDVKQAMVDIFVRWVELTDIDGFRIDTAKHVEHEFWRYFTQKVRQRLKAKGKNNFFMFGEAFDGKDDLVGSFTKNTVPAHAHDSALGGDLTRENAECSDGTPITGDMMDGVFYFPQYFRAIRNVFRFQNDDGSATQGIENLWNDRQINYGTVPTVDGTGVPPTKTLVNFLDNHDVPRFLYDGPGGTDFPVEPRQALKNALLFLFTEDGIPCVYYGTEQEFNGGNDPANREDLSISYNTENREDMTKSGFDTSNPTFQWIKRLIRIRKSYKVLQTGDQNVIWSSNRVGTEQDAWIFAFERASPDGDYAAIVLNSHPTQDSSPAFGGGVMTVGAPPGTVLVDVLSPDMTQYTVNPQGGVSITLPPVSGALLIPQSQVIPGL